MRIGNLTFDSPYFLAPLAGITDAPFRRICRRYGAGAVYSEMISAKGLWYGDKSTEKLLKIYEDEMPVAYQIFGSEPEIMGEAAAMLRDRNNSFIDINMGCPVPKVVKNGDGSALLRNPPLVSKVVEAVVKNAGKPVTVKIRTGWDDNSINAVETSKRIEAAGAAAICVHGRTRMQFYNGTADRDIIRQVVEAVRIPVLGNGDVFDLESARDMFDRTGCVGIMIGRAALGNPWIFQSLCEDRSAAAPGNERDAAGGVVRSGGGKTQAVIVSASERIAVLKEHYEAAVEEFGEYAGVRIMRKHVGWYIKGMRGAAALRKRINEMNDAEEVGAALDRLAESLKDEGL